MDGIGWHDAEMSAVRADLDVFAALALDPVLEIGAGTGRVALGLAARGYSVTAVEKDPELADELRTRGGGAIDVTTTDATDEPIKGEFGTVLIADGLVQDFGRAERRRLLHNARSALRGGGRLIACIFAAQSEHTGELPALAVVRDGWTCAMIQTSCRSVPEGWQIERRYEARRGDEVVEKRSSAVLHRLDPTTLARESGLAVERVVELYDTGPRPPAQVVVLA